MHDTRACHIPFSSSYYRGVVNTIMKVRKSVAIFLSELHIVILCGVLTGAFAYEFMKHELPCPLCFLQRMGMIAMSLGPLYNLLFGFRASHFAFGIGASVFSASVSIRQILLHICMGFPTYGLPVFGFELYTWAFIVAVCSLLGTMLLLFMYDPSEAYCRPEKLRPFGYVAIGLLVLLLVANLCASFLECGLTFCPDDPTKYVY